MGILKALRRRLNQRPHRENPSIVDFGDNAQLIAAMGGKRMERSVASLSGSESGDRDEGSVSSFGSGGDQPVEWTLPLVDEELTEPQSMDEEIKRLKALNDYFVLDSEGEVEFDRITTMASQIFDVPTALISLVDLGRQWFLSRVGLDATETPRKHAFCAHVILNKYKILVVPDATQDFRFKDNPLVTGGIKIRFYAGAALVSPEGYKLGTLCIISPKTRPEGLSSSQQAMLHEMAGMVVSAMVARRNRLLKEEYETRFLDLAKVLMDTNKSLDTSKETLQGILNRSTWDMDSDDAVELSSVARTLGVQSKICSATMRHVLQDTSAAAVLQKKKEAETLVARQAAIEEGFDGDDGDLIHEYDKLVNATTDMVKLFDNVNALIPTFPFHGTVSVEVDKSVPKEIIAEDLLLFRSTLNMLTHCMGQSGVDVDPDYNKSGLRIRRMKRQGNELLVQCLQAGKPVGLERAKELFTHKESLLGPVASMVRSLGGRYGMFEGKWDHQNGASACLQSIFWFQIPYEIPEFLQKDANGNKLKSKLYQIHTATEESMSRNTGNKIQLDPFQAALMDAGCGGRGRG